MTSKRKIPPSVGKYRKAHPVVGCVLTTDLKNVLDRWRGSLSYGEFIKKLLTEKLDPYKKGYDLGYKEGTSAGYTAGQLDYEVTVPCSICGEPMLIDPEDPDTMAMVKTLFKGVHHTSCDPNKND
jgi:hypothetical protein